MELVNNIKLLIAEPQPLMRESLSALCTHRGGFNVVAQCADGASALRLILELAPDVALLDLDLPQIHTLELLRRVRESVSETRMVLMSSRSDRKTVIESR